MPIKSRARTNRAVERDSEVLDAALVEVRTLGLDLLGMHGVARRAGITAGAVYSRHETVGELMVALWEHRCGAVTRELVAGILIAARGGPAPDLSGIVSSNDPALIVGVEMIAVCHRYPELAEVVVPELVATIGWERQDSLTQSRFAYLFALTVGALTHNTVEPVDPNHWRSIFGLVVAAIGTDGVEVDGSWSPRLGHAIHSVTGEPLRDALINAACSVIGEVGLNVATNSRISRRAGLTPGAVYTLYDSKDELLVDAMRVLLNDAVADNESLTASAGDRDHMAEASAHLMSRGAGDARRPWLRFRLEAYIAAMHRRDLAAVLEEVHASGRLRYEQLLSGTTLPRSTVHLIALVGQSMPLGLSVLDRYIDRLELIDHRVVTVPLLGSVASLARSGT